MSSFHAVRRLLGVFALGLAGNLLGDFQGSTHLMPYDEDLIGYAKTADTSPVAALQSRLDRGEVRLRKDRQFSYLLSILEELRVPKDSQMLVFSKTSFQRERIGPSNPRALFFNDSVYVGYVPGSHILEFTGVDPKLGAVFYTFDQDAPKPRFVRTDNCTECHASARTMGVPGHLVRSFETDDSGMVDLLTGIDPINHRTPLADRWGGWYVTGQHGNQTHRGNLVGKAAFESHRSNPATGGNLTDLGRLVDTGKYPASTSDIAALMILEHQQHGQNFITRIGYEARVHLSAYGHVNYLRSAIDAFVRYVLFADEARLTAPIRGSEAFSQSFMARGVRDSRGRSLRELDLKTRLFRYPCSYLLQSAEFKGLPDPLRERILQRIDGILAGREDDPAWAHLSTSDRTVLREILAETVPGYPKP